MEGSKSMYRESEKKIVKTIRSLKARIAQLVAYRLGTGEVADSNPGKGENFSVKIIQKP